MHAILQLPSCAEREFYKSKRRVKTPSLFCALFFMKFFQWQKYHYFTERFLPLAALFFNRRPEKRGSVFFKPSQSSRAAFAREAKPCAKCNQPHLSREELLLRRHSQAMSALLLLRRRSQAMRALLLLRQCPCQLSDFRPVLLRHGRTQGNGGRKVGKIFAAL